MKLAIIVLEDEPPVRDAIARDLEEFTGSIRIEPAEDVPDARDLIEEILADGDVVALLLADHRLPGESGVDFLVSTMEDPRLAAARRVLITGQADHADTIRAVNSGGLAHYIAKPWDAGELHAVVREQLTTYVLSQGLNPLSYLQHLDMDRAIVAMRDFSLSD
ncbi:MAG: response regulator [Propionibacteriaceae bacterium]|nr:response regulator [Propionibacteriaceae bacterium]